MLKITFDGPFKDIWEQIKSSDEWNSYGKIIFDDRNYKGSDIHFVFDYVDSMPLLPGKKNVLILLEPRSVNPFQYRQKNLDKFDLVIPVGRTRAENLGLLDYINCPIKFLPATKEINVRKLDFVILNANKFSANKNSLYGVRRKFSRYLYSSGANYQLHGLNWKMPKQKEFRERIWSVRKEIYSFNKPNFREAFSDFFYSYPEYIGETKNKQDILIKSKFAVIVENEKDYISEKIFDAIYSGCVPLYVGPNLDEFEKLSSCAVQINSNTKSLKNFIENYSEDHYQEKFSNILEAINNSDSFSEFSFKENIDKIVTIVRNKLLD
jgi:hypothetical protein